MRTKAFSGERAFLSNFHPAKVVYAGLRYPTVEHAYQAAKAVHERDREIIRFLETPQQVKRYGKFMEIDPNWEDRKLAVMELLLQRKFEDSELRELLLSTGDDYLEETNWWGDTFWGVCRGQGRNMLGHLLMELRANIRKEEANVRMEDEAAYG